MKTKKFKTRFNDVYVESFESLSDFLKITENRTVGKNWCKVSLSSHEKVEKRQRTRFSFYLTKTYEEANALLLNGYVEGVNAIKCEIAKLKKQTATRRGISYKPQGSSPSVGRYLSGNPNCMRKSVQKVVPSKVVRVYFSSSVSCCVDGKDVLKYGAELVNIVKSIEDKGYRTEIIDINISKEKRSGNCDCAIVTTRIKRASETLNLAKVSYCMVHPSWQRRHLFRWIETSPATDTARYTECYGNAMSPAFNKDRLACKEIFKNIMTKDDLYLDFYMWRLCKRNNRDFLQEAQAFAEQIFK